ncbi:MAG: carbohydrate binding domain-containing protein [Bacteroidota bacterium]
MKILLRNIRMIALVVMVASLMTSCDDDDQALPQVVSGFTQTIDQNTGTVTFINTSENADDFSWDFGDGVTSTVINPIRSYVSGTYTVVLTATNIAGGNDTFEDTFTITIPQRFNSGLAANGDFEDGGLGWSGNALNVQTEGGNSFNFANVETAGDAFNVNLSQVLELTQGEDYILTFDASSDRERTIIAGIGLNAAPFSNDSETVTLTTQTQMFSLNLSAAGFGGANSRILFDMGADVGTVVIDNVALIVDPDGGGGGGGDDTTAPVITLNGDATINITEGDTFTDPGAMATDDTDGDISGNIVVGGQAVANGTVGTYVITYNVSDAAGNPATEVTRTVNVTAFEDGLLTNGSFQAGADPWTIGVGTDPVPTATEDGNIFYSVDVMAAGQAFSVNMSQKLEIVQDETYVLTFDAWSDVSRPIIAGIGLSGGTFANTTEEFDINTTRQTYTATLTATGFGAADARVLFDLGAAIGVVNIDNVSLVVDGSGGGGGGGGGGSDSGLASNGDFETGDATGWALFQNGGTAEIDNTLNNGGSFSGRLVIAAPGNPAFKQERIGQGTVVAGDVVQVQFDHIGSVTQPGAVFNVILFGEGAGGASFTHVFNPAPVLSSGWTTFTGTFAIPGGTDVSEGISFLIEAVCGGDAGCSVTANIDNVSVTLNP